MSQIAEIMFSKHWSPCHGLRDDGNYWVFRRSGSGVDSPKK
jgi:hypothetical protein